MFNSHNTTANMSKLNHFNDKSHNIISNGIEVYPGLTLSMYLKSFWNKQPDFHTAAHKVNRLEILQ